MLGELLDRIVEVSGEMDVVEEQVILCRNGKRLKKKVNFKDFQYTEIEGCNYRMKEDTTCLDFLELYLTEEIMTLIVNDIGMLSSS